MAESETLYPWKLRPSTYHYRQQLLFLATDATQCLLYLPSYLAAGLRWQSCRAPIAANATNNVLFLTVNPV